MTFLHRYVVISVTKPSDQVLAYFNNKEEALEWAKKQRERHRYETIKVFHDIYQPE
jgi:hypothetical protein